MKARCECIGQGAELAATAGLEWLGRLIIRSRLGGMGESLLTTAQVAGRLSMSEEWVRDHAAALGAIRAGGSRAPLRFEPQRIEAWKERQRLGAPDFAPPQPRPPRARNREALEVELLPRPPKSLLSARG